LPATLPSAISDDYADYRYFYLKADVNQARKVMLLLAIPMLGFVFNDYLFFGATYMFLALVAVRATIAATIGLEFFRLGKAKTYQTYDRIIFFGTLTLILLGGVINATRPANYLIHAVMTIIGIFVLFQFVPARFRHQCVLVSFMVLGEFGIMLLGYSGGQVTVVSTLTLGMTSAFIFAAYSSWQKHAYRRRTFEETIKRRELQEELKKNSDNLARLVEVKTHELLDAQARLVKSERLAAIGELAGMVGHDLRNPLAGIKNATYFLRKKNSAVLDENGHLMLASIDRSVEHADKIIGDLLEYSRDIKLELSLQNPKAMITYVLFSLKVPEHIEILDRTESTPTVMVDDAKMVRVFTNLIKNAFEAMPEGGSLEILSRQNGGNVEFVFSDTGVGIHSEVVSRLFTPLVTTKAQGMGFGLAICKRFVEAHGGEITVNSMQGKGTTFIVSIPQAPTNYTSSYN
jgi:signal transduction histidine kinase